MVNRGSDIPQCSVFPPEQPAETRCMKRSRKHRWSGLDESVRVRVGFDWMSAFVFPVGLDWMSAFVFQLAQT